MCRLRCDWFKHDNKEAALRIPTIIKPSVSTAGKNNINMSKLAGDGWSGSLRADLLWH